MSIDSELTVTWCMHAGVLTFFESELSHIAQLLRELLVRRPSREDLQRQGIYKGTNLIKIGSVLNSLL